MANWRRPFYHDGVLSEVVDVQHENGPGAAVCPAISKRQTRCGRPAAAPSGLATGPGPPATDTATTLTSQGRTIAAPPSPPSVAILVSPSFLQESPPRLAAP